MWKLLNCVLFLLTIRKLHFGRRGSAVRTSLGDSSFILGVLYLVCLSLKNLLPKRHLSHIKHDT